MKRHLPRLRARLLACATFSACTMLLLCGLTAHAASAADSGSGGNGSQSPVANPQLSTGTETPYPADVQTIINGDTRQIVKTYTLTAGQDPAGIPRGSFTRDGWRYTLADITERRTSNTDARSHTETVEISTDTNDLNEIIKLLEPTMNYQSGDGFSGTLALSITSVNCEAAGYRSSSYDATATREYPHLSTADTSLIPKTITDNGRTLTLDGVTWEAQNYTNVDYEDIPDSYRAVASYTANIPISVVTGYITTAEYTGEIAKSTAGDTVYTAYFEGTEINPAPRPVQASETPAPPETVTPEEAVTEETHGRGRNALPILLIVTGLTGLAAAAAVAAYFFMRRNVKIYRDGFRVLTAKDKISARNNTIDLSPLDGERFGIEIDKFTAKSLNGHTVEVRHGTGSLKHRIAYEGNAYRIEADFDAGTIQAIY